LCLQEFEENLTLVEGKNHKNHLNALLLFTIIDFFIKTLLINVKPYSVREKNLNNLLNFSNYVYVKTNIIEEDFLKVINASDLENKYKQFHNIEYYPFIKNFDTIKIEFTNENKDDNIFADGLLDTIVTLHFKKRTKSLESDTSFLIKDNNYNNNNNNNDDDNNRKRKRNVFSPFTSLLNFE
jgi:hypothetical protein